MRPPPVYPVAISVAFVLSVYATQPAVPESLVRPVLIAMAIAILVQLTTTILLRDRDRGALLAAIVISVLAAPVALVIALASVGALLTVPRWLVVLRGQVAKPVPWPSATRLLDLITVVALVISIGPLLSDGRLTPSGAIAQPLGVAAADGPDIYVILLDGHPRADTLASEFGYDLEPFLAAMTAEGFDVARKSRSNYNTTVLTLTSMFNMRQIHDLPDLASVPKAPVSVVRDYLELSARIARAPVFDVLHEHGYEVIEVPSSFSGLVVPADRSLDDGRIEDLDMAVLVATRLGAVAPDAMRDLFATQHRDRIVSSFQKLTALAEERAAHPRFIFAHILSPHPPPVFGPGGVPRSGWSCFPSSCAFFVIGQPLGRDANQAAVRDQVAAVDQLVLQTVHSVVAKSARPPVIVVFSDHGERNDFSRKPETLRSLFLARTPGHPGLFPDDPTPVDMLPRLLNAYAGTNLPLTTEESYWLDLQTIPQRGLFDFVPIVPDPPGP